MMTSHMIKRGFLLMGVMWLLVACGGGDAPETSPNGGVNAEVVMSNGRMPNFENGIYWTKTPDTVVFRAEVYGGDITEEAHYARNDVPFCTVYGDNRVVWTTTTVNPHDGVVFDYVSDDAMRTFIDALAYRFEIYNYQTGADLLPPSDVNPMMERLTLFVNDTLHRTDSFGGWEYAYFQEILELCRHISTTPIKLIPDAAWVSAVEVPYDPNRHMLIWNGEAAGLLLSELAARGEPQWLEGRNVRFFWDRLRSISPQLTFEEGGKTYTVAVEVPNVTRFSPPAP